MKTTTEGMYAQLTEEGLTGARFTPAEIARDLAARLDTATTALAQKDATIKALAEALMAVREHGYAKRWVDNELRDVPKEVCAALRLAGVLR